MKTTLSALFGAILVCGFNVQAQSVASTVYKAIESGRPPSNRPLYAIQDGKVVHGPGIISGGPTIWSKNSKDWINLRDVQLHANIIQWSGPDAIEESLRRIQGENSHLLLVAVLVLDSMLKTEEYPGVIQQLGRTDAELSSETIKTLHGRYKELADKYLEDIWQRYPAEYREAEQAAPSNGEKPSK